LIAALVAGLCSNCGLRDRTAGRVLGQRDFVHNQANQGKMPQVDADFNAVVDSPVGIAVESGGRLFVVDSNNNRVLSWPNALDFENGAAADVAIGQPDLVSNKGNWEGKIGKRGLGLPLSVAVCGGTLAVADPGNMRVLLYDAPFSTGMEASKVFGQPGFDTNDANHGGVENGLNGASGVAFDCALTTYLYIADTGNNRIVRYKLGPNFDVRDLVIGQKDTKSNLPNEGLGTSLTSLFRPAGLAVSEGGDLYVADRSNNRVLGYAGPLVNHAAASLLIGQMGTNLSDPNMGQKTSNESSLNQPFAVALDDGGNLYVADHDQNRVLRFLAPLRSTSRASLLIGQPDFTQGEINNGGLNMKALFHPSGVAVDRIEDLLVTDTLNNRVLKYPYFRVPFDNLPDVILDRQNAKGDPLIAYGLAVDHKSGRLFVAGGKAVLTWKSVVGLSDGELPDAILGQGNLKWALGVAVDSSGNVWVADSAGNRVIRFSLQNNQWVVDRVLGQPDFMSTTAGTNQQALDQPSGVAVDSNDDVFVADTNNNRVLYYAQPYDKPAVSAAGVIGQHGDYNSNAKNDGDFSPNELGFDGPQGLAIDSNGNLYVADSHNSRVLRIRDPKTNPITTKVYGQQSFQGGKPNQGQPQVNAVGLLQPAGLALDSKNHLYVADQLNSRVMEYSIAGNIGDPAERVFGQQVFVRNDLRIGRIGFANTFGVVVDNAGNLLVSDTLGARVLIYYTPY